MSWSFDKFDLLPEEQFRLWEKLLERRTGIQLASQQKALLQTQIAIRMRELSLTDYTSYFLIVSKDDQEGMVEWQILIDRLVVKETMFFRHRPSLNMVCRFLQNKIKQRRVDNHFDILSVGCSTGEEAYGLAMLVSQCLRELKEDIYFGITALDVSAPALSIARKGIYSTRSMAFVSEQERAWFFRATDGDQFEVLPSIKQRVCFSQANISQPDSIRAQNVDVIFCQNVLIYFRRWRRRAILNQLANRLKPGGMLVIGLGEITDWKNPQMQKLDNQEVHAYVKGI